MFCYFSHDYFYCVCSYNLAILTINTMLYHIFETENTIIKHEKSDDDKLELIDIYKSLSNFYTLAESREFCLTICRDVIGRLQSLKDNDRYMIYIKAKSFIDTHLCDHNLSIDMIGDYMGLSAGYIGKIFNQYYHASITEYVSESRVEHAKIKLLNSNDSIQKISETLGFQSSTYFIVTFKKFVGMTPNSYRKFHLE